MFAIDRYDRPATLAEAVRLLAEYPRARPLAGGTDLLVALRESMEPAHVVDIAGLEELNVETLSAEGVVRLGAGLSFARLAESPLVGSHVPLLAEAAASVAGPQIRHMGTLGGNLCNGAVSADMAAPLLALDSSLRLVGPEGERRVPLAGFHTGPGRVALRPAELLIEVDIAPAAWRGVGAAWHKYAARAAMDIATVGCAAAVCLNGDRIDRLSLAFSVAGPVPLRCPSAEAAARGGAAAGRGLARTLAAVSAAVIDDVAPRASWRAGREFRLHLIRGLAARVTEQAVRRAGNSGR